VDNLSVWKRPLAYGVARPALEVAILALVLLLVVHVLGDDDELSRLACLAVLLVGTTQLLLGLGELVVVQTLREPVRSGLRGGIGTGDFIESVPQMALATAAIVGAWWLLRTEPRKNA
jgi:hypothetical protein